MRVLKSFIIGSFAFFKNFSDYKSKDLDELCIMDEFIFKNTNIMNMKIKNTNKDIFLCRNMSKSEFLMDTITCDTPMRVGKFLVPDFINYINLTIDDLKSLESIFNKLDDKHKYEKIIFDAYIENNDFILTEQQLNKAFEVYKKYKVK